MAVLNLSLRFVFVKTNTFTPQGCSPGRACVASLNKFPARSSPYWRFSLKNGLFLQAVTPFFSFRPYCLNGKRRQTKSFRNCPKLINIHLPHQIYITNINTCQPSFFLQKKAKNFPHICFISMTKTG